MTELVVLVLLTSDPCPINTLLVIFVCVLTVYLMVFCMKLMFFRLCSVKKKYPTVKPGDTLKSPSDVFN